jgi:hypothetical protein
MQISRQERLLALLLRFGACVTLLAFFAMFLPTEWMRRTHQWLDLGPFPDAPLTQYLTRSAAALYAMHGALLWIVSGNLRRHRTIVLYIVGTYLYLGTALFFIDLQAGLPWYWIAAEGPPLFGMGLCSLYLVRSVPREGVR